MASKTLPRLLATVLLLANVSLASAAETTGQPLPELTLPALLADGKPISKPNWQGKVVYVDFWASWCAPCRASFPWLNTVYNKYRDRGLVVIGVNKDQELAEANTFLAKFPANFPLVGDPGDKLAKGLGVIGMPTAYLIDRKGIIRYVHKGFRSDDQATLEQRIVSLLEEKACSPAAC
jgi:thiol-disulfide isomerase/thioredoxin